MDGVDIKKEGKAEVVWSTERGDHWGSCRLGPCLFLVRIWRRWPDNDLFFSLFCAEGQEEAFHLATDRYEGDRALEKEIERWHFRLMVVEER